jgi:hypothetical protein
MFIWGKALIAPINTLHSELIAFRKQKLYEIEITGQVCKLEKLLNDKFDSTLRRIFITDGQKSKRKYVFTKEEFVPQPIFMTPENKPFFIYQNNEITTNTFHFVVNVPNNVTYNSAVFISILNEFKMPSKKFKIVTF